MKALTSIVGRVLFALPFAVFGLFHFAGGEKMAGMVPAWLPGGVFWVYFTGAALVAAAAGIISTIKGELAALLLAALLGVFILTIHLPGLGNPDPQMMQMAMMSMLKDLALMGGALVIAGTLRNAKRR